MRRQAIPLFLFGKKNRVAAEHFTLIIDEFQEFYQINDGVYSDMQNLWDRYKSTSKMNLVLSGSVYSLMKKIFENAKEPLFGRANELIHLQPFSVEVIKTIVTDHRPDCKPGDLLAFYMLTGGVAKHPAAPFETQRKGPEIFN